MEGNHLATGIHQRATRLLDARQQPVERAVIGAGHAQARDVGLDACRKGRNHLLLDHPVR